MFKRLIVAWAATTVSFFCAQTHAWANALADPGRAAYESGRYDAAERIFTEALRAAQAAGGPEAVATASNNLGMTHLKQGRLRDADRLLQAALRHRESASPLSVDVAISLENLAQLRDLQGRHDDVVALLGRALAVKILVLGPRHPDLVVPHLHLASVHHREGNLAEAERLYREAIASGSGTARRAPHRDLPVILNNLAVLHRERGELADTERCLRQALAVADEMVPPDPAQLAGLLENLASLVGSRGKAIEARDLRRRAALARDPERLAVRTGW